jgi:hypothetical protein
MDVPLPAGPNLFLFSDPPQCERSVGGGRIELPIPAIVAAAEKP